MGNCSTNRGPKRKITVAVLGLDNAGKTSLLKCLSRESSGVSMPTIGFSKCVIQMRNYMVTFYDLGGSSGIRDIWKNYYAEIHGLIFVIDGSDWTRTEENRIVLGEVLNHEWIHGKPLLVIINKHDLNPDVNELILAEQLQLRRFAYNAQCPYTSASDPFWTTMCSAVKKCRRYSRKLKKSIAWLLKQVEMNHDWISEKIQADCSNQRRKLDDDNEKRMERIRKLHQQEETEKHRSVAITTVKTVRFTLSVEQDNSENQSNTEESLELEKYADVSKFDQQQVAETAENINDKTGNDDDIANDDSKRCVQNVNSEEHWKRSINNSTETNVRKRKRKRLARFHRVQPMDNK
ncbi:ADP-ribosylation factor-like protein 13B [Trichinella pseudospiralis]|uniref:ADP-ribosylation factor-like protein 13B n=1 Tax=Trichinella pseudospiralis TaxID=6337 RepID=A0A0V1IXP1_TRIPS|nr:ADP-ribosylation factor-like protein 13B [Trichinella pseudospiralis]KRZ21572.1 ADP-ribosylation factor-like protein 13B [Trichinella pseudospiralis]KRZ27529.1 ADP-ribosylation factor-like protein 13B [Trichinella pseudospiralis]